jgi:hypothetical protein
VRFAADSHLRSIFGFWKCPSLCQIAKRWVEIDQHWNAIQSKIKVNASYMNVLMSTSRSLASHVLPIEKVRSMESFYE